VYGQGAPVDRLDGVSPEDVEDVEAGADRSTADVTSCVRFA
jgi:hypothetical protein